MHKILTISLLAFGLATAATVAQADGPHLNVPRGEWLSVPQVIEKLSAQGYKVHEIEVDDGAYEFEATNASGVKVEGYAHPATGEVLLGYDD